MAAPDKSGSSSMLQRAATARRLVPFGQTIFTEISLLAAKHKAVNLGQGFPNFDGPDFIKAAAIESIQQGRNQYARMFGIPELNHAIAQRFTRDTGLAVDGDQHVTVTSGCTEAIAASLIGLVNEGEEVVLIEPYYDSYRACLAMAGATPRYVTLRPPDFLLTEDALRAACTDKTRAILINTPQNPTGRVLSRAELDMVARIASELDAIVLSDEVYERLVFENRHVSIASLPGMWERTVTLSSLGKSFSLTGWKVGWAVAPPHLTAGIRAAHQFLTFATSTPFQHAAVAALEAPDSYFRNLLDDYSGKRRMLVDGLAQLGLTVFQPQGTYFVMADHTPLGFASDVAFCRHLIEHVGVAAIPCSAFYHQPEDGRSLVRFAFCKTHDTLTEALDRLKARLTAARR